MQETKTIRNYKYALDYEDGATKLYFYSLTPVFLSAILSCFLEYGNHSAAENVIIFYPTVTLLFFVVDKLLKFCIRKHIISLINRIYFKFDNKYANIMLKAACSYDNYNRIYQNDISKLISDMKSPYCNQEMMNDIKELDNKIILLIDEDMKQNQYNKEYISRPCFYIIRNEVDKVNRKFSSFSGEYYKEQEKVEQQREEHLKSFLENLKK